MTNGKADSEWAKNIGAGICNEAYHSVRGSCSRVQCEEEPSTKSCEKGTDYG